MSWEGWTDENLATAKRMFVDQGESAGVVAEAIGAPSRSAIAGKAVREGWTAMRSQAARDYHRSNHLARLTKHLRRAAEARRKAPAADKKPREARAKIAAVPHPFPERPGGLRIIDPGFGDCRWPISGEGAETRFCCADRPDGAAYCAGHARVAYQPRTATAKGAARELVHSLRRYA